MTMKKSLNDYLVINEALDVKKIQFIPVKLSKSNIGVDNAVVVGNEFTLKDEKYATELEKKLTTTIGCQISVGIDKAKDVIQDNTTKLIHIIYNKNNEPTLMICNSNICKPLNNSDKLK